MLPNWMKRPIGSRPGHCFSARLRLMTATCGAAGRVALVEEPAAQQRDAHRLEVAGARGAELRLAGARLELRARRTANCSRVAISSTRVISMNVPLANWPRPSGKALISPDVRHAGQRAHARQQRVLQGGATGVSSSSPASSIDVSTTRSSPTPEPRVDRHARARSCAPGARRRPAAPSSAPPARRSVPRGRASGAGCRSRCGCCRRAPRRSATLRVPQAVSRLSTTAAATAAAPAKAIDAQSIDTWSRRGALVRPERDEHAHDDRRQRDADRRAARRDRQRLGQPLARDAPGGGADRELHRELAAARDGARHEQVRHVGAGDEQEQQRGREEQAQGRPHAGGQHVQDRQGHGVRHPRLRAVAHLERARDPAQLRGGGRRWRRPASRGDDAEVVRGPRRRLACPARAASTSPPAAGSRSPRA